MTAGPLGHIGRYELLAKLAVGGMGEVFLARTTGTGGFEKRLVIKRILPHLADDPEFIRRFIAEGKLVVRLRHAGIAQVLDMGEEGGVTFIAMEHVDGRDLGELMRLARSGAVEMPVPLIVTIIVRLLEALDYAHTATDDDGAALGIIHRDISPSNVMISRTGEVKLLDFGIARATERLQATTTGAIRGKYSYMSPQQAAGADLDARSDLFSLGVLMWELLAGFRPFDGVSDLLTLDRIRFFDPGPLTAAAPGVPGPVAAVVERLLQKAPADRFPSAEAAMRALMAWQNESGALVVPRDLSAWLERVLETLPAAMRRQPAAGLSLDDVLLMGLGSDPGQRKPSTAPVSTDRAPLTRTLSAPGVSPPRPGERAVTGPALAGAVATQDGPHP
ncbi:MAG: serine/threonine protein kinase, partial [Deltaproteobacteria bacterium HGW-Deltaproteobacteria-14]